MPTKPEMLNQVPLFSHLNQRTVKRLAAKFRERSFPPGTTVVEHGKMSGIGFFVVIGGEASVSVDGQKVRRLGAGDYFGELAMITERPRAATVTAETVLDCLEIPIWDFRDFAKSNPDVLWELLRHVVDTLLPEQGS
jgi:CRP/FNR family transcriptional regulator, cyclic AMP receptor protein